uniref:Secreted protein n=1 Tax=Ixodes ricinus TaxID=34613 RepID=A0A6B0U509_IXORI
MSDSLWPVPFLALAWVRMCDLRLVDWANFLLQPSKGQTYGRSPVWMRTWVRRLKSSEKRLPQPSNVHWKGFSPVCTS